MRILNWKFMTIGYLRKGRSIFEECGIYLNKYIKENSLFEQWI